MNLPIFIKVSSLLILVVTIVKSPSAFAQDPNLPEAPPTRLREKAPPERDFLFLASEAYVAGGTTMDMASTVDGLHHPTRAYRSNGAFLADYTVREAMFPGSIAGRNTLGVVLLNVGLNAVVSQVDRQLYRRGHRRAAITLNVLKGTCNWVGAIHNIRANRSADRDVALATGYTGTIHWQP